MLSDQQKRKLYVLIEGLYENTLSDTQFGRLDRWLQTDAEACEIYLRYVQMWVDLPYLQESLQSQVHSSTTSLETPLRYEDLASCDLSDSAIWKALLYAERTSPGIVPVDTATEAREPAKKMDVSTAGKVSRFRLFTILAASAALLMILLLPFVATPRKEVATLADDMNVEWLEPTTPMAIGQRLRTGQPLRIQKGIVKLEFDDGARVIVEAPAAFQLTDTNQVMLYSGHFSAWVPARALGFTAYTHTSRIVDLGTEFGIEVRNDGTTRTHMFEGKASLVAAVEGAALEPSLLSQGQARQMDIAGKITDIPFEDRTFVRQMDSHQESIWRGESLDLGDVFMGGNGLGSGTRSRTALASNPLMDLPAVLTNASITDTYRPEIKAHDPCYFEVDHPYIDGVFIPDGGNGPVQVSSLGHRYPHCPDTRGVTWRWAFARDGVAFWDQDGDGFCDKVELGERLYGKTIVLHSNMGITFDLNALRSVFPKTTISEFKTRIGMAKHPVTAKRGPDFVPRIDLYILLDGQERMVKKGLTPADEAIAVSIPIEPAERFLTLMATNGDDGTIDFDYGLFADAHLTLKQMAP